LGPAPPSRQSSSTLVANAESIIADFPYTSAVPTPPDFTHAGQPYFADGFAPPPDHLRVFPHTLIPSESKKIFAIPVPAGRSPMITIGQSTDYATFITSAPNHGFYSSHKSRPAALLAILQHFVNHKPPATLCFNCFTHHLPRPCVDPPRNFQALIDACTSLNAGNPRRFIYSQCPSCNRPHPPRRGSCHDQ
jgi:hypothetical protein